MIALRSLDAKGASLVTPNLLARVIRKFATHIASLSYSIEDVEKDLVRVTDYCSKKGARCGKDGNAYSVEGKLSPRKHET